MWVQLYVLCPNKSSLSTRIQTLLKKWRQNIAQLAFVREQVNYPKTQALKIASLGVKRPVKAHVFPEEIFNSDTRVRWRL